MHYDLILNQAYNTCAFLFSEFSSLSVCLDGVVIGPANPVSSGIVY